MTDFRLQGKQNRASGADFEKRTRKDLEDKGWVVDKWTNNVDLGLGKLVRAKNLFRGKNIPMMMGAGFPDFSCHRYVGRTTFDIYDIYEVIGVECKVGKYLSAEEKEKCQWLLDNKIFSKILIAFKTKEKNKIVINYKDFILTSDTEKTQLNKMEEK